MARETISNLGWQSSRSRGRQRDCPVHMTLANDEEFMTRLSRRRFLGSASATGFAIALSPAASLFYPRPANAWILAVGLAVGAFVAGQIASHNRRNIDLYYLHAIYKELAVLSDQVASLQTAMALALQELAKLPSEIDRMLRSESVRQLYGKINSVVVRYERETQGVRDYTTRADWLSAPYRKDNLNKILNDLWDARTQLELSDFPTDPSSALVVTCAALTEMGLLNALNYDRSQVMGRLGEYEEWFARVLDSSRKGSAAEYLASAKARQQAIEAQMRKNTLGAQLAASETATGLCAGLTDYRGPYEEQRGTAYVGTIGPDKIPKTRPIMETVPARIGKVTRIWMPFAYRDIPAEEDAATFAELKKVADKSKLQLLPGATGLIIRTMAPQSESPFIETKAPNPEVRWAGAPDCPMESRNFPELNAEKLKAGLQQFETWKKGLVTLAELQALLDSYNLEASRIVFSQTCIAAVNETTKTLAALKRSYN
jgi:hypothetical protein